MRLRFTDMAKSFGTTRAVDRVSLTVEPGELFFVLGPSGCGKTTLLRITAGLETADGGDLLFGERRMNDVPAKDRNAAMVFQQYALWPHMTVEQNVAYGLKVRKLPAAQRVEQVADALAMVGMADYGARFPAQLSGGQQQRVALARALVVRPDLLLLDEPLSNLDARLRRRMRQEIRTLQKQAGITTLYVTHDQDEAMAMADRVAVMRDGRLEQVATPVELYERPVNAFVARFLGEANLIDASLVSVGDGRCTVASPLGRLEATARPDAIGNAGDELLCLFRPEAVRLNPPEGGVGCTVLSAAFGGDRVDYELGWDGGEPIRATVYHDRAPLPEGATATFGLADGALSVIQR